MTEQPAQPNSLSPAGGEGWGEGLKKSKFADLPKRILTAIALIGIVIGALLGGPITWGIFLTLVLIGLWIEWYRLTGWSKAWRIVGLIYLPLPCLAALYLGSGFSMNSAMVLLLPFFIVPLVDSFAYFGGKLIGGPKLASSISPKKTWSGLLIGCFAAMIATAALLTKAKADYGIFFFAILGLALALLAQAGDLLKSWIKRKAGVKDSGQLLPGHGGLLDRFDGFLFTLPTYALLVFYVTASHS